MTTGQKLTKDELKSLEIARDKVYKKSKHPQEDHNRYLALFVELLQKYEGPNIDIMQYSIDEYTGQIKSRAEARPPYYEWEK